MLNAAAGNGLEDIKPGEHGAVAGNKLEEIKSGEDGEEVVKQLEGAENEPAAVEKENAA